MGKRILLGILWFFVVAWAWNWVALLAGLPQEPGIALGALAAAFVLVVPHRHAVAPVAAAEASSRA